MARTGEFRCPRPPDRAPVRPDRAAAGRAGLNNHSLLPLTDCLPIPSSSRRAPKEVPLGGAPKEVPLGGAPKEVPLGGAPKEVPLGDAPKEVPLGGAPKEVPLGGAPKEVPLGGQAGGFELQWLPPSYLPP